MCKLFLDSTDKREVGGMESVSAMKAITKSWSENFQKQLPFRETYVRYLEKKSNILFTVLLHSFLQHQFTMKSKANKHLIHMIHIRLINKETYDYQRLKKMNCWETFGFQR